MAAVTMSPSDPANSSATVTSGPRRASCGYETGCTPRPISQPMTRRASFSTTSWEMCPPLFPRTSMTRPLNPISVRRSRWKCAQPSPTMSGMCR